MDSFHRLRGCNQTADWATGPFALGIVDLKPTSEQSASH